MSDVQHFIDGKRAREPPAVRRGVQPRDRGGAGGSRWPAKQREVGARSGRHKGASPPGPRPRRSRRARVLFKFWNPGPEHDALADDLRRARQDVPRRAGRDDPRHRGRRVRLRHPASSQGRVHREGRHRRRQLSLRQPLGVVAGITPFNFPAMVPMWMFPMALACGNAFILKPSERDPSAGFSSPSC